MKNFPFTESDLVRHQARMAGYAGKSGLHDVLTSKGIVEQPQETKTAEKGCKSKQTKCEMEYGRMLEMEFKGCPVIPWGITLRMQNGHKYTPDFVVLQEYGFMLLVEVKQRGKNGFRQNSYQRAKLAFDQCKVEYPMFQYRWAEKHNGQWSW